MNQRLCWCGHDRLLPFNADYGRCEVCETLVLKEASETRRDRVVDDETDFYGKQYWFEHQEEHHGFANLRDRARHDLGERCLHWLAAVLKYKLPPGDALELGCAHGGFVALLNWTGFEAWGLELSPSVASFAREAFGVDVRVGPIEAQQIAPGTLTMVAAMDVLEHVDDPLGLIRHSVDALREDGVLVFQTPRYPEGASYEQLVEQQSPFLQMLQPQEHTYLFSAKAINLLFERAGVTHVSFQRAIFAHYDMFVIASRAPLVETEPAMRERALEQRPASRIVKAMLDLRAAGEMRQREIAEQAARIAGIEHDRGERLAVIERQGEALGRVNTLEADIVHLTAQVEQAERDRQARLDVIERQGAELGRISGLEADIAHLRAQIEHAEIDRQARLEVIERQGAELGRIPGLEADIAFLKARVAEIDADRNARSQQYAIDRAAHRSEVARLHAELGRMTALESDFARLKRRLLDLKRSPVYRTLSKMGLVDRMD